MGTEDSPSPCFQDNLPTQAIRRRKFVKIFLRFLFLGCLGYTLFSICSSCLQPSLSSYPGIDAIDGLTGNVEELMQHAALRGNAFFQVAGAGVSLEDVFQAPRAYNGRVIIVPGNAKLSRRRADQPFLSAPFISPQVTTSVNTVAAALETALGRPTFHFTITPIDFYAHGLGFPGPYVLWEVSSGRILVDSALAASWTSPEAHQLLTHFIPNLTSKMPAAVATASSQLGSTEDGRSNTLGASLAVSAAAALVALAVAAAVAGAPPLWFCLACPAVLGLVAPLAINFGLNAVATEVCTIMQISNEDCFDLWIAALAMGFVLSLASAIPIFYVCRMYECEHRNATSAGVSMVNKLLGKFGAFPQ